MVKWDRNCGFLWDVHVHVPFCSGGCYKHTFYGIESHRCMETTPSLACANKCVFCWRHHTNPVGTEWRWTMDEPAAIVDGAMANHYDMIKQFRGACSDR